MLCTSRFQATRDLCAGSGSFGIVFQGEYFGTMVAVKRMRPELITPEGMEMVKEECRIMLKIRHIGPNHYQLTLYEQGCLCLEIGSVQLIGLMDEVGGSFAMVLEYCGEGHQVQT